MSEKPSQLEGNEKDYPNFTPGMNVVKKGPQGSVYKFIEPYRGMVKLREFCGTIIELDQKYFLENFEPQNDLPQVVQLNGIEYKVTLIGGNSAQLTDLENPKNIIVLSLKDLNKLPRIDTIVPTPPPSQVQKKNQEAAAERKNDLIPYPPNLFSINKRTHELNLPN